MAGGAGDLDFCYLTTLGRVSGAPHQIEIWFALHDGFVYLLSGGGERSDWVKNLIADPSVTLRLGEESRTTPARVVSAPDEDALARLPKGFSADTPHLDAIKLRHYFAMIEVNLKKRPPKDLPRELAAYFHDLLPLMEWLRKATAESQKNV